MLKRAINVSMGEKWHIYDNLVQSYNSKAPVNVKTYHKCINGEKWHIYDKFVQSYNSKAPVNDKTYHKCVNSP